MKGEMGGWNSRKHKIEQKQWHIWSFKNKDDWKDSIKDCIPAVMCNTNKIINTSCSLATF